jgi:Holliday junction resolvasome RuvABC endonuclease subunit
MKNKILALDLGTKTGWALFSEDEGITGGTQSFCQSRFDGGGIRFLKFHRWLEELLKCSGNKIDIVFYEEVRRHLGVDAAHIYGGFLAVLTSWCEEHKIPYHGVPVGTIKKHATGKGNAGKNEMITAARNLVGCHPDDDNHADAICLLYYSLEWSEF